MSLFITFEGGEGCGKDHQADLLVSWLRSKNLEVVLTKEPGGTKEAWPHVSHLFQAISAQVNNTPCCTWIGEGEESGQEE